MQFNAIVLSLFLYAKVVLLLTIQPGIFDTESNSLAVSTSPFSIPV